MTEAQPFGPPEQEGARGALRGAAPARPAAQGPSDSGREARNSYAPVTSSKTCDTQIQMLIGPTGSEIPGKSWTQPCLDLCKTKQKQPNVGAEGSV